MAQENILLPRERYENLLKKIERYESSDKSHAQPPLEEIKNEVKKKIDEVKEIDEFKAEKTGVMAKKKKTNENKPQQTTANKNEAHKRKINSQKDVIKEVMESEHLPYRIAPPGIPAMSQARKWIRF